MGQGPPSRTPTRQGGAGEVGRVRFPFYIRRVPRPLLLLLPLLLGLATPAAAACNDAAAPGVDWRRCLLDERDLTGADLAGAVLRDASLGRARMAGAKLAGVEATQARFVSTDLTGADLSGAGLLGADFTRAVLLRARLKGADLRRAKLFRADLTGADLTGVELLGADLSYAILDGARWTDGTRICAPGSVGACQ